MRGWWAGRPVAPSGGEEGSRTTWTVACLLWAVVGGGIALSGFGSVNPDARALVSCATAIGVASAVLAALLVSRGFSRWAGLCLVVSVVTPTWAAAALNLLPLAGGLALLVVPRRNFHAEPTSPPTASGH